ncbi:MAG: DUF1292 domain-containing protein [Clostridia bacterium]|nr:DUF1292 domain-containing protein [Clostridia bacterium]
MERFEIGDVLPLTDEEGVSTEFEVIGTTEDKGVQYLALIDTSVEEPEEYVILKVVEEDGETLLVTVDDDDEFDNVSDTFDDMFDSEIDYDAE